MLSKLSALLVCAAAACAFLACAASTPAPPIPGPPVPPPQVEERLAPSSPDEAGLMAARAFLSKFPDAGRGRAAVGWPQGATVMEAVGLAFAGSLSSGVLLRDLGAAAGGVEEAVAQLAPDTFGGLFWLTPLPEGDFPLTGIVVTYLPTGAGAPASLSVDFAVPIALPPPSPAPSPSWSTLVRVPERVISIAARAGAETEIWWATDESLVRFGLPEKSQLESLRRGTAPAEAPPARPVLRFAEEPGGPLKVGFWDPATLEGRFFARSGTGWEAAPPFDGFPFSEREARFFGASFDAAEGAWTLTDFQGRGLGKFLDLVKVKSPLGSLWGLLGPGGLCQVVAGNTSESLIPPTDVPSRAIAAAGDLLLLASLSPPYRVTGFRLREERSWETAWESPPLPTPPRAICAGFISGRDALLVSVDNDGGSDILSTTMP